MPHSSVDAVPLLPLDNDNAKEPDTPFTATWIEAQDRHVASGLVAGMGRGGKSWRAVPPVATFLLSVAVGGLIVMFVIWRRK